MNDGYRLVAQSENCLLYAKIKNSSKTWANFILEVKHSTIRMKRFHLGWNGERLADQSKYDIARGKMPEAFDWAQSMLKQLYPKIESEVERQAIQPLETSQFDLVLFDLDDTLLQSSHLERFRGKANVGNRPRSYIDALTKEARSLTHLIPVQTIQKVRSTFPSAYSGPT